MVKVRRTSETIQLHHSAIEHTEKPRPNSILDVENAKADLTTDHGPVNPLSPRQIDRLLGKALYISTQGSGLSYGPQGQIG